MWERRKRGTRNADNRIVATTLGRIPTISLSRHQSELYYLRMLLHLQTGATSFEEIRTIEGEQCEDNQSACVKLGLLDDDIEKDKAMQEAANLRFGHQLHAVFATILLYCTPTEPLAFWEKWKTTLACDIMRSHGEVVLTDVIEHTILLHLQERVQRDGLDLHKHYGLPLPNPEILNQAEIPAVIREETNFDTQSLQEQITNQLPSLNSQQRDAFDKVIDSVTNGGGTIFCLNGNTYVVNMILAKVRSMEKIALATAMSGIAATLLDNGRTLHSRLKIPLDMKDESVCNFSRRDATGKLLQMTSLLVIDEVSMGHKHIFECVDRSLRDIRQIDAPFGGLTVLLAGDWKQILPVVRHGGRPEIVEATLKRSYLWPKILPLQLSTNMRVSNAAPDAGAQEFSEYLQDVGSGAIPLAGVGDVGPYAVAVPSEFQVETSTISNLCDFVFHDLDNNFQNADWLASRAIIAPTNKADQYDHDGSLSWSGASVQQLRLSRQRTSLPY